MQMDTQKCTPTSREPGSDDHGHHGMRKARDHSGPPYLMAGNLRCKQVKQRNQARDNEVELVAVARGGVP